MNDPTSGVTRENFIALGMYLQRAGACGVPTTVAEMSLLAPVFGLIQACANGQLEFGVRASQPQEQSKKPDLQVVGDDK